MGGHRSVGGHCSVGGGQENNLLRWWSVVMETSIGNVWRVDCSVLGRALVELARLRLS